jgi:hypothetical protein
MTASALPTRRPFLPEDLHQPKGRAVCRAAFAIARNAIADVQCGGPEMAASLWPHDKQAIAVTRAATSPATIGTVAWAGALSPTTTADFVSSLVGMSAGAKLIDAGMRIDLTNKYAVLLPHRSANLPDSNTQWIAEGGPIPVRQYALATSILGPVHKLATSVVASRELLKGPGGEDVLATLMREDVAVSLDASLFSNAAATAIRPAGLMAGITALTATPSTGGLEAALRGDIAKLAAVVTATGSANVAFVVSPAGAVRLASYPTITGPNLQVWPSLAVADGTIIAIAVDAFVSGFGSVPRISTSDAAVIHMEDTAPLQIATGAQGSGVLATPARSLWQTDSIAVRCILDCSWALRSTAAVAWITGATW